MVTNPTPHSKLPWKVHVVYAFDEMPLHYAVILASGQEYGSTAEVAMLYGRDCVPDALDADAEFIVRAVNAHDDLLAILREFVGGYGGNSYPEGLWPLADRAKAAIAKAEP